MEVKSYFSTNMDPYRAGIEIGEKLAEINPEIIFLFPTIHYKGSPELVEAIYDVLESDKTLLIGNTGDGFYELNNVANAGVSALGINTNGSIKWHIAHESGIGQAPFEKTSQCISRLNEMCSPNKPDLYFFATDFRTDTSEIVSALQKLALAPIVGGSAGDDIFFKECFVYANRKVLTDSIVMLAIEGDFLFDISVANNLQSIGKTGVISEVDGTTVKTINNIPAMDFLEQEIGKPLEVIDEGTITLKLTESGNIRDHQIRSVLLPENRSTERSLKLFGGVKKGNSAKICLAPPDKIIQDVKDIVNSLDTLPFKPLAALIVSCAGRKKVLGDNIRDEVQEVIRGCSSIKALAGFPSFGEFGPVKNGKGYSKPLFHNMTFILLLIGEKDN